MSKKIKVLVTGGAGYIGSHTVVELYNNGYEVIIVDNLSNSDISAIHGIEKITGISPNFVNLDLKNKELTKDFFNKNADIDAVIHFAAYKAVGESVEKPLKYYENNLNSLINVLQGMKENNIENIVFSSSCTVYGQPDKLPVTEKAPIKKANSPYGNTKQIAEEILEEFIDSGAKIKAIALRYFNPIGAHKSALIGELPIGVPNNLVPFITQTAAGLRNKLSVFGSDYNTTDGSAIRDYIHVVDLAKAHIVSVDRMFNNKNKTAFEMFNIGTGIGLSVLEIIKSFEKATEIKLNYQIVDRRAGDIEKVWADTSFANTELNWKAETDIETSLLSAWNWEKHIRNIK